MKFILVKTISNFFQGAHLLRVRAAKTQWSLYSRDEGEGGRGVRGGYEPSAFYVNLQVEGFKIY